MANNSVKYVIKVYGEQGLIGFVKSISHTKMSYERTTDFKQARKFSSQDTVIGEIDFLQKVSMDNRVAFVFDIIR